MEKTKLIGWLGAVLLTASIGLLFVPGAGVVAPVAAILALLFAPYTEFLGDFTEDKINDIEFRIKENEALGKIIEKLESYAKEKGYDIDYDISKATTLLKKIKLFILSNACKKDEDEIKKYIDELNKAIENIPFFKMLSELHTKWADEQRKGKSGDDTPFCGPNREQIKRFLYGFKKEELLQFSLTDSFRQEVSIETTDAYKNASYDVQKECKQLWDDLKAIYIEAMLNGVCDTEQKVLAASIALMVTNQVKRVLGEDSHEFATVVERLEKLLHMNPGGFTLRDVEAGKSFLANYMVNNRCPECGYLGDGVFRDGVDEKRLLCAACGADISFEQYAAPEVYQKYAEMVDTKLNEFKAAYEEHCNKHKEELQLSFDEFKDQIISAFTKLEISQKIRLDEHGESIARLDESVGELSEEVKKLLDKLTEELKQHENDVQAFTEAVNQSREWQQTADVYFKAIFDELCGYKEGLDNINESIKQLGETAQLSQCELFKLIEEKAAAISDLRNKLNKVINDQRIGITTLSEELNQGFNTLSKKMDEASQQNTEEHNVIIQKLEGINTTLKELTDEKPSGEANEVQKQLEGINTTLKELTKGKPSGEANEVQKQLEEIKTTLSKFAERFEKGEAEKKRPSDKEDDVDKQLTEIKATLQTLIKTLVPSPRPSDEFSTGSTNLKSGGDEQPVARPLPQGENTPYVPTGTSSAGGGAQKPSQPIDGTPPALVHPVPTPESRCAYCGAKNHFTAYIDPQGVEKCHKCKVCGNEFEELDISAGEVWRQKHIPSSTGNLTISSRNDGIVYVESAPQSKWRIDVTEIANVKLIICGQSIRNDLEINEECLRNIINNPITIVYMATGCVGLIS